MAPFAGAGLGASYISVRESDLSGSGLSAYAEVGATMLRSGKVGFYASLRADAPFYSLKGTSYAPADVGRAYGAPSRLTSYVFPVSLNAGLAFR